MHDRPNDNNRLLPATCWRVRLQRALPARTISAEPEPKSAGPARARLSGLTSRSCTGRLRWKRREQKRARAFQSRVEVFVSLITTACLSAQSFTTPNHSGNQEHRKVFRIHRRSLRNLQESVSFFSLRELCVVVVNQISVTLCPS